MTIPTGEVKRVADQILARIMAGGFAGGMRLPSEVDLGADLSCGRSTVREALRYLTGLGVVQSRRGSGAMVLDFRREGTPALLPAYVLAGRFDRPVSVLVREMLRMRGNLATDAVRLAALYATPDALEEPRLILERAPLLERDAAAHALNELELFRALVLASGIWPAAWLANVFWAPLRELHANLAPLLGGPPPGYQRQMEHLFDLIARRDADGAVRHLAAWLEGVDAGLLAGFERALVVGEEVVPQTRKPARNSAHSTPKTAASSRARRVVAR